MALLSTTAYGDLPFLDYQAESPIDEELEWLTDVIESHNGNEQRIESRSKPRQYLSYRIPLSYFKKSDALNTVYGAIRADRWAFPIWQEAQYIGSLTEGQTTIDCDTRYVELIASGLALLYSGCGEKDYQAIEIQSLNEVSITIASPGATARNKVWLIPVKTGFITGSVKTTTNGLNGHIKIRFKVDNVLELIPEQLEQFLGNDVNFNPTLLESGDFLPRTLEKQQDIIDFKLGNVSKRTHELCTKVSSKFDSMPIGFKEIRDFKEFLYRRAGKFRSFWMPTFESDLELKSTGLITTAIKLGYVLDSLLNFATDRIHIAIKDKNGVWYPRTISNFLQVETDIVQFDITPNLDLEAADIELISWLGLNRFNSDKVSLNWKGSAIKNGLLSITRRLKINPNYCQTQLVTINSGGGAIVEGGRTGDSDFSGISETSDEINAIWFQDGVGHNLGPFGSGAGAIAGDITLKYWHSSYAYYPSGQTNYTNDRGRMSLSFFTEDMSLINNAFYDITYNPTPQVWTQIERTTGLPANTKFIGINYTATRLAGTSNNDYYVDDIELSVDGTPITIPNPGAESGLSNWTFSVGELLLRGADPAAHSGGSYIMGKTYGLDRTTKAQQIVEITPLQPNVPHPINTQTSTFSTLTVTKKIIIQSRGGVIIRGKVNNSAKIYWNGELISYINSDNAIMGIVDFEVRVIGIEGVNELTIIAYSDPNDGSNYFYAVTFKADPEPLVNSLVQILELQP